MRRRLRNLLLRIAAFEVAAWIVAQLVADRLSQGAEWSDEFRVVTIGRGKEFHSDALRLRSGSVTACMSGVDLDLRDATLDPSGATIDVNATMGGVRITVPDNWAVDIDQSALAAGVDAKVRSPETLPDDAPALRIRAVVRMGGVLVAPTTNR